MSADVPLKVVIGWHMHQPHYLEPDSGRYQLPWTYLHAIKDYVDMAALLEAEPGAHVVVNFAPTLLEQLDDYAAQVGAYLEDGMPLRDPLLAALATPALPSDGGQRLALIEQCLRANDQRLIRRFPAYAELAALAGGIEGRPARAEYLSSRFLADLLVWYHLAWLGETVRRDDERVRALIDKGNHYSIHDRRQLLGIIGELLAGVLGRYRHLAESGQVELSVTPYAHPMAPLLLDFNAAREAQPELPLPEGHYPGGAERLDWQIAEGLRVFEEHFGFRPAGCWPAEGGVSEAALGHFAAAGFKWLAAGGQTLNQSLGAEAGECIHLAYRRGEEGAALFFRDDGLSDLIGFRYADWHADDAVADLLKHLRGIAQACEGEPQRLVTLFLDGENAWEYYPENGYHFLSALYRELATASDIELTTFSAALEQGLQPQALPHLVAGSWVYGNFSTWMGDADKNRGWALLVEAKHAFDAAAPALDEARRQRAERQLAICEGSDWFWWFGDYNPVDSVRDFERLYRLHLAALYHLIGVEPPEHLDEVISHGGGTPAAGGTMRPGQVGTGG